MYMKIEVEIMKNFPPAALFYMHLSFKKYLWRYFTCIFRFSSKFLDQKPLKFSAYGALKNVSKNTRIFNDVFLRFGVWTRHNFEGKKQ